MTEYIHACEVGTLDGAELWYLSKGTYGKQLDAGFARAPTGGTGTDGPLSVITEPYAPEGDAAVFTVRRIYLKVAYRFGGFTVRITPVLDFTRELASQAFTFPDPPTAKQVRDTITMKVAGRCTFVHMKIEILDRRGRVVLYGPSCATSHVTSTANRSAE